MNGITATIIIMIPVFLFIIALLINAWLFERERKLIMAGKKEPWGVERKKRGKK